MGPTNSSIQKVVEHRPWLELRHIEMKGMWEQAMHVSGEKAIETGPYLAYSIGWNTVSKAGNNKRWYV